MSFSENSETETIDRIELEKAVKQLGAVKTWFYVQARTDVYIRTAQFRRAYQHWEAGKEYYHLLEHFSGFQKAMTEYIEYQSAAQRRGMDNDPLHLIPDLAEWNQLHNTNFTLEMFQKICDVLADSHDCGNSYLYVSKVSKSPGRTALIPRRYPFMNESRAEERSCKCQEIVIESKLKETSCTDESIVHIVQLVNHLTMISQYDVGVVSEERRQLPFYRFVTACDQIGANIFCCSNHYDKGGASESTQATGYQELHLNEPWITSVFGLMLEKIETKVLASDESDTVCNPWQYFNFVRLRLPELLPLEEDRVQLQKIWCFEVPDWVNRIGAVELPNRNVPVVDFLNEIYYLNRAELHQRYHEMLAKTHFSKATKRKRIRPGSRLTILTQSAVVADPSTFSKAE